MNWLRPSSKHFRPLVVSKRTHGTRLVVCLGANLTILSTQCYWQIILTCNMTGATFRAAHACPSGAPHISPGFVVFFFFGKTPKLDECIRQSRTWLPVLIPDVIPGIFMGLVCFLSLFLMQLYFILITTMFVGRLCSLFFFMFIYLLIYWFLHRLADFFSNSVGDTENVWVMLSRRSCEVDDGQPK